MKKKQPSRDWFCYAADRNRQDFFPRPAGADTRQDPFVVLLGSFSALFSAKFYARKLRSSFSPILPTRSCRLSGWTGLPSIKKKRRTGWMGPKLDYREKKIP